MNNAELKNSFAFCQGKKDLHPSETTIEGG
jgi:hypothetical protein